jgi:hypothetical protein
VSAYFQNWLVWSYPRNANGAGLTKPYPLPLTHKGSRDLSGERSMSAHDRSLSGGLITQELRAFESVIARDDHRSSTFYVSARVSGQNALLAARLIATVRHLVEHRPMHPSFLCNSLIRTLLQRAMAKLWLQKVRA